MLARSLECRRVSRRTNSLEEARSTPTLKQKPSLVCKDSRVHSLFHPTHTLDDPRTRCPKASTETLRRQPRTLYASLESRQETISRTLPVYWEKEPTSYKVRNVRWMVNRAAANTKRQVLSETTLTDKLDAKTKGDMDESSLNGTSHQNSTT